MRAGAVCQLDREQADSAASAVDEDTFAALEAGTVEQALPRGKGADGDGSSSLVAERCGFVRQLVRQCKAIFGGGAVGEPVVHAEDSSSGNEGRTTLRPVAATIPENSCPGMRPERGAPSRVWVLGYQPSSVGVTAAAQTRIRTSLSPGLGAGISSSRRTGLAGEPLRRRAFIVWLL